MTITISVNVDCLQRLDVSPVQSVLQPNLVAGTVAAIEQQIQFAINYPREANDPRELPEIPEIRLWFIRLDVSYPWLPVLLDWQAGELARYTAMLVPHEFSPRDGIRYNPEALELFVMQKVFAVHIWLQQQGWEGKSRLKGMAQLLGYDLDDEFFDLLCTDPSLKKRHC